MAQAEEPEREANAAATAVELWGRLYEHAPFEEKVVVASRLLEEPGCDPPGPLAAVWLFEWLTTGSGAAQKRLVLRDAGLDLLCSLLDRLPQGYQLGPHQHFLMVQLQQAVAQGEEARGPVEAHMRLAAKLLSLPFLGFHPLTATLFTAASSRLVAGGDGSSQPVLLALTASAAKLLGRALELAQPKKAFRDLLAALPSVADLAAVMPEQQQHSDVVLQAETSGWCGTMAAARKLLAGLFERRHLEGFEALARAADLVPISEEEPASQPAKKRARKAAGDEDGGKESRAAAAYQAGLFKSISGLLRDPRTSTGCAALLPQLLADFAAQRRRAEEVSAAMLEPTIQGGAAGTSSEGVRKATEPGDLAHLPYNFWFFLQLSHAVRGALEVVHSAQVADSLVRCLVEMWKLVRSLGAYRPREDPRRTQARALDSFCGLLLQRLGGRTRGAEAQQAPEWSGLLEVLALDSAPFESRLHEAWRVISHHCHTAVSEVPQDVAPWTRLAVALLRTYADLADLPSCFSALLETLQAVPYARITSLLGDERFLAGIEDAVAAASAGSAAVQATTVWESLLQTLQRAIATGKGGSDNGADQKKPCHENLFWPVVLLQHVVRAVRTSELSLQPIGVLLLRSFKSLRRCQGLVSTEAPVKVLEGLDGLSLALCILGRSVGAWEIPACLHPPSGDAEALAAHVSKHLRTLVGRLRRSHDHGAGGAAATAPCLRAAVQWLAFREDSLQSQPGVAGAATGGDDDELSQLVLSELLKLAAGEAPHAASNEDFVRIARQEVCSRLMFLARYAERFEHRQEAIAVDADSNHVLLASALVPSELSCWRHLARRWQDGTAANRQAAVEKSWAPVAEFWEQRAEAIADHPFLRAAVLGQLASLLAATAGLAEAAQESGRQKQILALLGLQGALCRVTAVPFRGGMAPESMREAYQATARALMLVLDGAEISQSKQGAALLVCSLRCLAQLLEMMVRDHAAYGEDVIQGAVSLVTGSRAGKPRRLREAAGADASPVVAAAVLLAGGAVESLPCLAAVEAMADLSKSLLHQRLNSWPLQERQRWIVELACHLCSAGLQCVAVVEAAEEKPPTCCISIQDPTRLLAHPEDGDLSSAPSEEMERSLRLLLGFLGASGKPPVAVQLKVLGTPVPAPRDQGPFGGTGQEAIPMNALCSRCAGLTASVIARCADRSTSSTEFAAFKNGGDKGWLLQLGSGLVRSLRHTIQQLGAPKVTAACSELLRGAQMLVKAISASPWPDGEEEELWQAMWAPLVLEWVELLASVPEISDQLAVARAVRLPGLGAVPQGCEAGSECCALLCASTGRDRREAFLVRLAQRAAVQAMHAQASCDSGVQLGPLLGLACGIAVGLHSSPQRPTLRPSVVHCVTAVAHALLALSAGGPEAELFRGRLEHFTSMNLCMAAAVGELHTHLAAPLLYGSHAAEKKPRRVLSEAEVLLLLVAGTQARTAVQLCRSANAPTRTAAAIVENLHCAADLHSSAYNLLSAMFSAVPTEGARLPTWTKKPHVVVEILKTMLEVVYLTADGAQAARMASDVVRLWEAYSQGGTRQVAHSAGKAGLPLFQAKVQRATKGFLIMILAHVLEQQRCWAGVDAAVHRSLKKFDLKERGARRKQELARWKEVTQIIRDGLDPMFAALEGSEHLKQGLYAGLQEPLSTMFKELHEAYQKRGKYQGQA